MDGSLQNLGHPLNSQKHAVFQKNAESQVFAEQLKFSEDHRQYYFHRTCQWQRFILLTGLSLTQSVLPVLEDRSERCLLTPESVLQRGIDLPFGSGSPNLGKFCLPTMPFVCEYAAECT